VCHHYKSPHKNHPIPCIWPVCTGVKCPTRQEYHSNNVANVQYFELPQEHTTTKRKRDSIDNRPQTMNITIDPSKQAEAIKMRNELINRGRLYFGNVNNLAPLSETLQTSPSTLTIENSSTVPFIFKDEKLFSTRLY
jgi:hypothetical protein